LEDSLGPKEAVLHWLGEAHAFGSLPDYVDSLIDQPETMQPFVALPKRVEQAVWDSMRRQRPAFIKEVMREATGDTVFLLRLVIGLNVHLEETLRIEGLRLAALMWWSRARDSAPQATDDAKPGGRADWRRGVSTLRSELMGTERARAIAETRYLDGHDCLFPELAAEWRELCAAAEMLMGDEAKPDEELDRGQAEQRLQRVVLMAHADGLDVSGQWSAADAIARLIMPSADETATEGERG